MADITLYDYWRSSASYRVRIALNLKGLAYDQVVVNLLAGEHRADAHRARSPIGYVPALEIDGQMMTQSMAILPISGGQLSGPCPASGRSGRGGAPSRDRLCHRHGHPPDLQPECHQPSCCRL